MEKKLTRSASAPVSSTHPLSNHTGRRAMTPPPFHLQAEGAVSHDYNVLESQADNPYHVLENQEHPYHVLENQDQNPYHVLENGPANPYQVLENNAAEGYSQAQDSLSPASPQASVPPMILTENEDQEITNWQVPGTQETESGVPLQQFPFFGWFSGDGPQNHNMDMIQQLDPAQQTEPIYASLSETGMEPQENPYASLEEVREQMQTDSGDSRRAIRRRTPVDPANKPSVQKRVTKVRTKK